MKKTAESVLQQIQPDFIALSRALGGMPRGFATDKFVIGFFIGCYGIAYMRAGKPKFDNATQGNILAMVAEKVFGPNAPAPELLGDLMNQVPHDPEFAKGNTVAVKLRAFEFGLPGVENDPDVIAARDMAKKIGSGLDFLGGDPSGKATVGSQLLLSLLWRPILSRYKADQHS